MSKPTNDTDRVLDRLVERCETPFSRELGLDLTRNTPSVLFRRLCAARLMSARISHETALAAARALSEAGWTTSDRMADRSREDRVATLNAVGYARHDESTARMPGDTARRLCDAYGGDLRNLRAAAHRLGVPDTAETLAVRAWPGRFARIVTALVRAELAGIGGADLLEDAQRAGP